MKKLILATVLFLAGFVAQAQIKDPVKWQFTAVKLSPTSYELHLKAIIDPGWHIYTMDHTADIGVATSVTLNTNPLAKPTGKIKVVGKPVSLKDPGTGELVKFHEKSVDLVQVVTLKAPVKTNFTGAVEFMTCDDKQCLPPTSKTFSIALQ